MQAEQVEQETEQLIEEVARTAEQVARTPQDANEQIQQILNRIQSEMREKMNAADREALINVLVSRTDMTEEEAQQAVLRVAGT